jgi:hypothetical protein
LKIKTGRQRAGFLQKIEGVSRVGNGVLESDITPNEAFGAAELTEFCTDRSSADDQLLKSSRQFSISSCRRQNMTLRRAIETTVGVCDHDT